MSVMIDLSKYLDKRYVLSPSSFLVYLGLLHHHLTTNDLFDIFDPDFERLTELNITKMSKDLGVSRRSFTRQLELLEYQNLIKRRTISNRVYAFPLEW